MNHRPTWRTWTGWAMTLFVLGPIACSSGSTGTPPSSTDAGHADATTVTDATSRACAPGQQISCACSGSATTGVQVCSANGQSYGTCTGCPARDASSAEEASSRHDAASNRDSTSTDDARDARIDTVSVRDSGPSKDSGPKDSDAGSGCVPELGGFIGCTSVTEWGCSPGSTPPACQAPLTTAWSCSSGSGTPPGDCQAPFGCPDHCVWCCTPSPVEGPNGEYPGCYLNMRNDPYCQPWQPDSWECELYDAGVDPQNGSPRESPSAQVLAHCSQYPSLGLGTLAGEYCCARGSDAGG
jgi:hypothetical protein